MKLFGIDLALIEPIAPTLNYTDKEDVSAYLKMSAIRMNLLI
ncbi:hypothetical protein [Mucilaginibacter gotjawali]|uniref:Uncharacterized protein n=2 Tax=Mucilaginibacter gotjawali TaxID=1550579 RepID=A0A0X8X2X3_9SPHI|nr:hypothetical protein [Mucilaginibacter gotjawali]MBB3057828.1 hypothetical protein [Mucilaginibacter gotjawali]BAU52629.1 hypothetical protein MgSA37_00791 [Mucilaginibacter gotjawali]